MITKRCISIVLVLWNLQLACSKIHNFISTDTLEGGLVEKLVHFNGITAKETLVFDKGDAEGLSLKVREMTDGVHFIKLIYSADGTLWYCKSGRQVRAVQSFLEGVNITVQFQRNVTSLDGMELPSDLASWMDFGLLKRECRRNRRLMDRLARGNGSDPQSHRSPRSVLRQLLILPGTNWCGVKDTASHYDDIGFFDKADRCCRAHDKCPEIIPGQSTKYQLYNPSPFTLSHCDCDSSFRACLKKTDTISAYLVGKIFFNMVRTECFVITYKKSCKGRNTWGMCVEEDVLEQARIRDNESY